MVTGIDLNMCKTIWFKKIIFSLYKRMMQLTKLANVKSENIIFCEPKELKVKESKFRYQ